MEGADSTAGSDTGLLGDFGVASTSFNSTSFSPFSVIFFASTTPFSSGALSVTVMVGTVFFDGILLNTDKSQSIIIYKKSLDTFLFP